MDSDDTTAAILQLGVHEWRWVDDRQGSDTRLPEAIEGIEDIVISFLSQLASFGRPSRGHPISDTEGDAASSEGSKNGSKCHSKKAAIKLYLVDRSKQEDLGPTSMKCMKYPKKCSKGSLRPMAQLLRVLDLTHEAVIDAIPATKRDIYYRDVSLFKSQRTVDLLVDDIAATLTLKRSDLNIRASSKGLVSGSGLVIHLHTGEALGVNDTEGTLIPVGEDIKSLAIDAQVAWVLVVEKEAVFQTLCRLKLTCHDSLPRGLIVTGKGYPDIATRHLVKTLEMVLPDRVPVLAMVDGDPYGLDILSVFKFGSRSLHHENSDLAASRIVWLGLWSSELTGFGIDRDRLLPITKHDEAKGLSMLKRPAPTIPANWRKELMHMLHCRRKAEIEILSVSNAVSQQHTPNLASNTLDTNHTDIIIPPTTLGIRSSTSSTSTIPRVGPCPSLLTNLPSTMSSPQPVVSEPSHAPLLRYLRCKIGQAILDASVGHPT